MQHKLHLLNPNTRDALIALQTEGEVDIYQQLLSLFLDSSSQYSRNLIDALQSNNLIEIAKAAHAWQNSALAIGADQVAQDCKLLENAARMQNLNEVQKTYQELTINFTLVRSLILTQLKLD